MADAGVAIAPAHEAAATGGAVRGGGEDLAVEEAAFDFEHGVLYGDEAAVGAVVAVGVDDAAMDDHAAAAVHDETISSR